MAGNVMASKLIISESDVAARPFLRNVEVNQMSLMNCQNALIN